MSDVQMRPEVRRFAEAIERAYERVEQSDDAFALSTVSIADKQLAWDEVVDRIEYLWWLAERGEASVMPEHLVWLGMYAARLYGMLLEEARR